VLIDFTRPEGTMAHLQACEARGVEVVIGTTGFSEARRPGSPSARDAIAIVRWRRT
jgi:4-hydroxy-tetrahydrodipicolinate reductase